MRRILNVRPLFALCLFAILSVTRFAFGQAEAEIPTPTAKHRITGLFSVDRVADLKAVMEEIPAIELLAVDYTSAEVTFRYEPAKAFPGAKPEQIVERFDGILRQASNHTFGVKPLRSLPLEKLKRVEIPVVGLDCKGCCFGAYEAIQRLPGVETATASFRDGLVTALIDPAKIDRTELETALKQRGVQLKAP